MTERESLLYSKALAFAAEKHGGQVRRDGTPYILHPIRVSKLLLDAGYDVNYQIAGLFHDLLEDTDATEEEISAYGEDVLEAVVLVSKNKCDDMDQYVDRILMNHMAAAVKNCDRIDNLCDARYPRDRKFQEKYLEDSKKYAGKFSKALDLSISSLDYKIHHVSDKDKKEYADFPKEYLELYSDQEKRMKAEKNEELDELIKISKTCEKPDVKSKDIKYYTGPDIHDSVFCIQIDENRSSEITKTWILSSAGWIPTSIDPFEQYEYELYEVDRDYVLSYFRELKETGGMCDFVTEKDI